MSRLDLPAVKYLVSDLLTSKAIARVYTDINRWVHGDHHFSVVWIQGNVLQACDGYLELDDGTGRAEVDTIQSNLPKCAMQITEGNYVMVVGELLTNVAPVRIKAIKVQDLSKDTVAQEVWQLEIQDLHRYGLQEHAVQAT